MCSIHQADVKRCKLKDGSATPFCTPDDEYIHRCHITYLKDAKRLAQLESRTPQQNGLLYELLLALETGLIRWEDVPINFFDDEIFFRVKTDHGIDLTHVKKHHLIQAKYRSDGNSVTWREVSNFTQLAQMFVNDANKIELAITPGA